MKFKILILFLLIFSNIVNASIIKGTIYDFSLEPIKNALIGVNSVPPQKFLTRTGEYSFQLSSGVYNLTAKSLDNTILVQELIEIKEEGIYNIDLFAFPELEENEGLVDLEEDISSIEKENSDNLILIIPLILTIIIIALIFYKITRKKKKIEPVSNAIESDLTNKVLEIIKNSDGRTTQKEIRKKLPYSEAKISLIITELESKNKIEKIKKGRGNIIILKK